MSLEYTLLGLICMHQDVSGYGLHQIMNNRTQNFLSNSLSHIYPALQKLTDRGYVSFRTVPIKNRPAKKLYQITPRGEKKLQLWLKEPVSSSLDMNPFFLKMAFSPLMDKATILNHIDREIAFRKELNKMRVQGISTELDFLDRNQIELPRAELLWEGLTDIHTRTEDLRLEWLNEWRERVEEGL